MELRHLRFQDAEALLLKVAQDLRDQKFRESLPPQVLPRLDVEQANGGSIPAGAVSLHLPGQSAGNGLTGELVLQAKLDWLRQPEHGLLPPRTDGVARKELEFEPTPRGGEPRIGHG